MFWRRGLHARRHRLFLLFLIPLNPLLSSYCMLLQNPIMEHSSLIATFSLSSLRKHFHTPSLTRETAIEVSSFPTISTGEYGFSYALPVNSTPVSSTTIHTPQISKLVGAITIPSSLANAFDETKHTMILFIGLLLGIYFFCRQKPTKRLHPSHQWPEYPFTLIHSTKTEESHQCSHYSHHAAQLMATTHNTILRGLNAVYAQSFYVRPGTKAAADLLTYCSVVIDFLHHHHDVEERIFFPAISAEIRDPSFMEQNIAQHRSFESGLKALHLLATTTPPSCFSAHTLRHMIDSFAPVLTQHLHDEIPSILSLHNKMPSATLRKIYGKMLTAAEKESDPLM